MTRSLSPTGTTTSLTASATAAPVAPPASGLVDEASPRLAARILQSFAVIKRASGDKLTPLSHAQKDELYSKVVDGTYTCLALPASAEGDGGIRYTYVRSSEGQNAKSFYISLPVGLSDRLFYGEYPITVE